MSLRKNLTIFIMEGQTMPGFFGEWLWQILAPSEVLETA
jgi:hypothetical protein